MNKRQQIYELIRRLNLQLFNIDFDGSTYPSREIFKPEIIRLCVWQSGFQIENCDGKVYRYFNRSKRGYMDQCYEYLKGMLDMYEELN